MSHAFRISMSYGWKISRRVFLRRLCREFVNFFRWVGPHSLPALAVVTVSCFTLLFEDLHDSPYPFIYCLAGLFISLYILNRLQYVLLTITLIVRLIVSLF